MEEIIMIKEDDVIPGRHGDGGIRVFGDAAVAGQFLIADAGILRGEASAGFTDGGMGRVAAIGKAELPVGVCLGTDGRNHFQEEGLRRVEQRNDNTEFDGRSGLCRRSLGSRIAWGGGDGGSGDGTPEETPNIGGLGGSTGNDGDHTKNY